MSTAFSPVVAAEPHRHATFRVQRVDVSKFGSYAAPIMGLDHYQMDGVTFAPHPHAGFSAVSYLFEDSPGGLRNRDSLGNDFVIEPGGVGWTQAGSGVLHDELPAEDGRTVHGVQVFVNLAGRNKGTPPRVFQLGAREIPEWTNGSGRVRVISGRFSDVTSPLDTVEPCNFLDAHIASRVSFDIEAGWNTLVYVMSGALKVNAGGTVRSLRSSEAVALRDGGSVSLEAIAPAHALILSGRDPKEPVVFHGPFIMNDQAQIADAVRRYQSGGMGHLQPLR